MKILVASIDWWKQLVHKTDSIVICNAVKEIEKAAKLGKTIFLLVLQEGGCIGNDLQRVSDLFNLGVRIIQLTYNKKNSLGSGCAEPPTAGLTNFGRDVIAKMNQLGIVVDLSHCNYQTTLDGIHYSQKPVAVTHGCCKAIFNHARAKTDEEIRALADNEGFFGVLTVPFFLSDKVSPDWDEFLRHFDYAVSIMGIDRVGIGSDWGLWSPDVPKEVTEAIIQSAYKMGFKKDMKINAGVSLKGMNDYTEWIRITEALVVGGYSDKEITGFLGKNFVDFFKKVTD